MLEYSSPIWFLNLRMDISFIRRLQRLFFETDSNFSLLILLRSLYVPCDLVMFHKVFTASLMSSQVIMVPHHAASSIETRSFVFGLIPDASFSSLCSYNFYSQRASYGIIMLPKMVLAIVILYKFKSHSLASGHKFCHFCVHNVF